MKRSAGLLLLLLAAACSSKVEPIVIHRSSCEVCHRPLDENAQPFGIEDAHPWLPLACVDCHGGNAWVCSTGENLSGPDDPCAGQLIYVQDLAHVSPPAGGAYLKNLSSRQLDNTPPDYLRFINPGDFRVAHLACGGDGGCHQKEVDEAKFSTMAHTSGEVTVARYRAMAQDTPHGVVGGYAIIDPSPPDGDACAVESLELFDPPPLDIFSDVPAPEAAPTVANVQDQYMVRTCMRCHLNDFGENPYPGDFRSSGCTACHMPYANDGFSRSADPWVNKQTVPHPITHQLTKSPPTETCTHCHYRGGRIGISYQGYRESAAAKLNPENPGTLGEALHNHPANWYLTDENTENDCDETPPDLHFEAGMHCVDCHTKLDVHGNGHLYADTQCAVSSECTDCHGTVRKRAAIDPTRKNLYEEDGKLWLRTRVTEKVLEVPQTIDTITPGAEGYSPAAVAAMGIDSDGFSHTDQIECYTCHAGWIPTCYGCHVTLDMGGEQKYQTTGVLRTGRATGERAWVVLNDLVLLWNSDGLLAPSMPAERFTAELLAPWAGGAEGEEEVLFTDKPRTFVFDDGRVIPGFGQRAFNPHTTRRKSQFMSCDRCHTAGDPAAPSNKLLLDLAHGFGTQRFPKEICDVTNEDPSCGASDRTQVQLDRIMTDEGLPLVVVGHPDPIESRVLTLDEVKRMREVVVPVETPIPEGAATDPGWPPNSLCQ